MSFIPWFYSRKFLMDTPNFIRGNVVDIGCGTGKYRKFILSLPHVNSYIGIDFYKTEQAKMVADLNSNIPVADNSFDTALCISVLEHLLEPQNALNEIYRILKPGGHLLLTTPWIFPFHGEPNDYFRYSRNALEYMFQKSGFDIVSITPTGGKARIMLVFFQRWFPIFKGIFFLAERFIPHPNFSSEKDEKRFLNAPSHQVVAVKNR